MMGTLVDMVISVTRLSTAILLTILYFVFRLPMLAIGIVCVIIGTLEGKTREQINPET